jgi:alkylhydroperoxidase family enzyme
MRIDLPEEHHDQPIAHLAEHYAPEIVTAGAVFATAVYQHSKLSLRELEGARYRTAQINGCNICLNFRGERDFPGLFEAVGGDLGSSVHARGPAPDEDFYGNVANWRHYPDFSERERLVIRYAEGLGLAPDQIAHDEEFWARAKAAFSDDEIVDLSYSIAAWMGLGRVMHALGLDAVCAFKPVERRSDEKTGPGAIFSADLRMDACAAALEI